MEASYKLKQVQHFSTCRKVQDENSRVHQNSLIPGEWVSSIGLSDAYLHIPIHPHARKYLRFCHRSQVFQLSSLPFGLSTAPQVFTMIVKEVKLTTLDIALKARHIPGCLNVMADLLSGSNQVQSTEWSLHPQVFKQICQRWFTPHVDLFTTHPNHKLPLYVSPIPDPKAWDIDALNITGRVSLPMLPLQRLSFTR